MEPFITGSFPISSTFGDELSAQFACKKSKIYLMGARRSGKSSIQKVVFYKMSPHETLFLESTNEIRIKDIDNNSYFQFQIVDFPGNFVFSEKYDSNRLFSYCSALIFVIDSQDYPFSDLDYLINTVILAYKINPLIHFHILIHKVDGETLLNSDESKIECQRIVNNRLIDEFKDQKLRLPNILTSNITSIYDHSIFEAFSQIVQKMIPELPNLEVLLDSLNDCCNMEKSFLFDVISKIYIATDRIAPDMATCELCSDMIDVVIDVSCIYGVRDSNADGLAFDEDSASVIKLSNGDVLYLRQVNKYLALVCLIKDESFKKNGLLVDFNFKCFRQGIEELFHKRTKKN